MKKGFLIVAALMLLFALTGCLGSGLIGAGTDYVGSWRTARVESDDYKGSRVNLELNAIGTCSLEIVSGDGNKQEKESYSGTWKVSGDEVVLKCEEDFTLAIDGEELVYSDSRMTVYLEVIKRASDTSSSGSASSS